MVKNKNILNQQSAKFEFMAFLEFIEKATRWKRTNGSYIFQSDNGIDGITDKNLSIDICVKTYDDYFFYRTEKSNRKCAYIYLGDKEENDVHTDDTIALGPSFIKRLAQQNPVLWWLFISSCSDKCRIITDKDGKNLVLKANKYPYIYKLVDVEPHLKISNIDGLSKVFEEDFKYQRKHSNETYVVVGNGISIPFGSDQWSQLSNYLFDYLKPLYIDNGDLVKKAIGNNNFSITSISQQIIEESKYDDALYSCIYRKYEKSMHSGNTLIHQIALSKMFNNDLKIISYNYDEFLEIDFNEYCHPDIKIKPVCNAKEDNLIREPKIRHVHGFVSIDRKIKKGLVLTQEEYYQTYKNNNWVVKTQAKALESNCLFVGSSMSDLFQMSVIDKVRNSYNKKSSAFVFTQPWKCYALMCFKGLSARDIATIYCYYLNKGIRIIFTCDFDKLPLKYSEIMSTCSRE